MTEQNEEVQGDAAEANGGAAADDAAVETSSHGEMTAAELPTEEQKPITYERAGRGYKSSEAVFVRGEVDGKKPASKLGIRFTTAKDLPKDFKGSVENAFFDEHILQPHLGTILEDETRAQKVLAGEASLTPQEWDKVGEWIRKESGPEGKLAEHFAEGGKLHGINPESIFLTGGFSTKTRGNFAESLKHNFNRDLHGTSPVVFRGVGTVAGAYLLGDALMRGKTNAGEDRSWATRVLEGATGTAVAAGSLFAGARAH